MREEVGFKRSLQCERLIADSAAVLFDRGVDDLVSDKITPSHKLTLTLLA